MATSKTGSTASALLAALPESPDSYPQKLDLVRSCALLIGLDAASYRAASFLDDRILAPATVGAWLPLEQIVAAAKSSRNVRPLHYILHTGHVGSTLLSRLLDTTGNVLPLREPLPLRTLAEASDSVGQPESLLSPAQFDALLEMFARLWGRGYPSTHSVVLKATSAAARVAPALLRRDPGARAVYLNLRAEPYLATLLAGPNSAVDLRGHGPERMRRMTLQLSASTRPLHALSHGELAAMSWLAESLTQHAVLAQAPDQTLAVDFDELLADLPGAMARIAAHLALQVAPGWLERLASDPALSRYSKSPDHEYSPALRAQVLAQARQEHAQEIHRGLTWLDTLARSEPVVARVLHARSG
jgi:hypothetical protein